MPGDLEKVGGRGILGEMEVTFDVLLLSHPRGVIIHTVLLYLTMCFCYIINGGNHLA